MPDKHKNIKSNTDAISIITILNNPDMNKPYALAANDAIKSVMPIFMNNQKFMKPAQKYVIAIPANDLRKATGITLNTSAT